MLYKTQKFKNPIYLGDPYIAVRIFNDLEVDELMVIDYSYKEPNFDILEEIASEAFMPLVYGGGVRTHDDFEKVIKDSIYDNKYSDMYECALKCGEVYHHSIY